MKNIMDKVSKKTDYELIINTVSKSFLRRVKVQIGKSDFRKLFFEYAIQFEKIFRGRALNAWIRLVDKLDIRGVNTSKSVEGLSDTWVINKNIEEISKHYFKICYNSVEYVFILKHRYISKIITLDHTGYRIAEVRKELMDIIRMIIESEVILQQSKFFLAVNTPMDNVGNKKQKPRQSKLDFIFLIATLENVSLALSFKIKKITIPILVDFLAGDEVTKKLFPELYTFNGALKYDDKTYTNYKNTNLLKWKKIYNSVGSESWIEIDPNGNCLLKSDGTRWTEFDSTGNLTVESNSNRVKIYWHYFDTLVTFITENYSKKLV